MSESKEKYWSMSLGKSVATIATLVILAWFTIPHFVKSTGHHSLTACENNLRRIDAAAKQFALEHHLTNGAPINFPDDLMPYIKLNSVGKIPRCPAGGIYSIKRVGDTPICSLGTTVSPEHVLSPWAQ
jgi:hypothetical protein